MHPLGSGGRQISVDCRPARDTQWDTAANKQTEKVSEIQETGLLSLKGIQDKWLRCLFKTPKPMLAGSLPLSPHQGLSQTHSGWHTPPHTLTLPGLSSLYNAAILAKCPCSWLPCGFSFFPSLPILFHALVTLFILFNLDPPRCLWLLSPFYL